MILPTTAEDMITLPKSLIARTVLQAGIKARKTGATFFGFGLYSSLGRDSVAGIQTRLSIPVVTGEAFSLVTAIEGLRFASRQKGFDLSGLRAAVIGACGPVGSVFAELLARETRSICLLGKNEANLARTANKIFYDTGTVARVSQDMPEDLKKVDVVVVDPYYGTAPKMADYLRGDSIVCDISSERFLLHQIAGSRNDVMLIEGGKVEFPEQLHGGWSGGCQLMEGNPSVGETMMRAMERNKQEFMKETELDTLKAEKISKLAKKYGFRVTGFKSFMRNGEPGKA